MVTVADELQQQDRLEDKQGRRPNESQGDVGFESDYEGCRYRGRYRDLQGERSLAKVAWDQTNMATLL